MKTLPREATGGCLCGADLYDSGDSLPISSFPRPLNHPELNILSPEFPCITARSAISNCCAAA